MVQTSKTKHKYKTGAITVTVGRVGGESGRVGEGVTGHEEERGQGDGYGYG